MYEKLLTYIRENWDNTRRFNPEDTGIKIGMPYPLPEKLFRDFVVEYYKSQNT